MYRYKNTETVSPAHQFGLWIVLIAATLAVISTWPAMAAEQIADQGGCIAAITQAEDAIVRANIDSATFRVLNDQLVEMRTLCGQDDFAGAEAKLLSVTNALKDIEKKS